MSNKKGPKMRIKITAVVLAHVFIYQLFFPTMVLANTNGAGQAENKSFIPAGASDNVNLFTGDFMYNIPLLDIEGYPLTLSYDGNVGMHSEASWVGLGWNCTPGFINREMRGLPDDMQGQRVTQKMKYRPDITISTPKESGGGAAFFGSVGNQDGSSTFLNSYTGAGYEFVKTRKVLVPPYIFSSESVADLKTIYNSNNGFSRFLTIAKSDVEKKRPLFFENVEKRSKSTTTAYNSRFGLTGKIYGGGISTVKKPGLLFDIASIAIGAIPGIGIAASIAIGLATSAAGDAMSSENGANGSSVISTGTSSYTPQVDFQHFSYSASRKDGWGYNWIVYNTYNYDKGYASAMQMNDTRSLPAYGYMYSTHWLIDGGITNLYDVNKDHTRSLSANTPNLPVSNATYDVFHTRGEGIGGEYRIFRNDVGAFHNSYVNSPGGSLDNSEVNYYGIIPSRTKVQTSSIGLSNKTNELWDTDNDAADHMLFNTEPIEPDQEVFYFKNTGEKIVYNDDYYDQYGGDQPAYVQLEQTSIPHPFLPTIGSYIRAKSDLKVKADDGSYSTKAIPENDDVLTSKGSREPRNQLFTYRRTQENPENYLESDIIDYSLYTGDFSSTTGTVSVDNTYDRSVRPSEHLSEITVTKDNGSKYIYGIPVYNNYSKQKSMNAGSGSVDVNGLVPIPTATHNGYDDYESSTELPEYATGYLLTAIVSADYIDRTGDGPTEDDYGNYTKFNYSQTHETYKWRMPYEENKGIFNEVHYAYPDDNTTSYSYGEKEVWYVHSVESKNYIAEFYLSDRKDGFEVTDEDGGRGSNALKKLDRIELYTKEEREEKGSSAIPVKVAHFVYDYSLCTGVPHNNQSTSLDDNEEANQYGKLTLKKVFFTYGKSIKSAESAYQFSYGDTDHDGTPDVNYSYSFGDVDRWGNYKNNTSYDLENSYVAQDDRSQADEDAASWRLTDIITPEGSEMQVNYEADDYGYVQNKRAMQMFEIVGTDYELDVDDNLSSPSHGLYNATNGSYNYLFFKLQESGITQSELDEYFEGLYDIYFKALLRVTPSSTHYEYVTGYGKVKNYGLMNNGTHGWIELDPDYFNGNLVFPSVNPMSKAGWQALRNDVPRTSKLYLNPVIDMYNLNLITNGIADNLNLYAIRGLTDEISDFDSDLIGNSWIRLNNPNYKKIGGGARVSKILVKDAWDQMGGSTAQTYETEYSYTTTVNREVISSGVAAYEPSLGNDENPWKQPYYYTNDNDQIPDDYLFQHGPYGESHFPSPTVGYSEVKVETTFPGTVTRNATGHTVHQFNTAKDFPTIVKRTDKQTIPISSRPTTPLQFAVAVPTIDHLAMSQGFTIHRNDMHGKPKGSETYNEEGSLVNKSTIYYKSNPIGAGSYQLDNTATIINSDGSVEEATIGKDIDIYNTYAETNNYNGSYTGTGITKFYYGLYSSGMYQSSISQKSKKIYTSVMTKVVDQYGLIDRIEMEEQGTKQVMTNLAYDGKTGSLLLNSVHNEYKDSVFSFHYPAHWYYDKLGQEYQNVGIQLDGLTSPLTPHDGIVDLTATEVAYFTVGDKLSITYDTSPVTELAWVLEIDDVNNKITCIDEDGTLIQFSSGNNDISIVILESGRKNLQNLPIGNVKSLTNPISTGSLSFSDVLESSAIEFSDDWKVGCSNVTCDLGLDGDLIIIPGDSVNPFIEGIQGKWRAQTAYSYNQDRVSTATTTDSDIRTDGTYTSFLPFWDFNTSGELVPIYDDTYPTNPTGTENWKINTEITHYGKDGNLMETKDILNRHATSLYGYNPTYKNIPIAIASNAKQQQIGVDNFEDYEYLEHTTVYEVSGHFNFSTSSGVNKSSIVDEAHTGVSSLRLFDGDTITMNRIIRPECTVEDSITPTGDEYRVEYCDCEYQFSPEAGKYIVSAWVKQDVGTPGTTITEGKITIQQKDNVGSSSATDVVLSPSGPVIEGWQRIMGEVEIDEETFCLSILLSHEGDENANDIYFDDVRVHPFNSAMKTMVYHPRYLLLMAELDNENYATFFEYDREGTLVRIKKETEKGIVTVKETRSSLEKNYDIGEYVPE